MTQAGFGHPATGETPPDPLAGTSRQVHWIVRQNWRQRTIFFPLLAVILGVHLHDIQAPVGAWMLLLAHFFVYPRLVYRHAVRESGRNRQRRIEWRYMILDTFLYGIWMTALGFPLWPTLCLALGGLVSMVAYRGLPGGFPMLLGLLPGLATAFSVSRGCPSARPRSTRRAATWSPCAMTEGWSCRQASA